MMSDPVLAPIKSKIKIRLLCDERDKSEFSSHHCMLGISVGQAKHEGEKFKATVEKVNRSFSRCTIMLADTLQRHSLKARYPALGMDELHEAAKKEGDAWLNRNEEAINLLNIPYEIVRWDAWLSHPRFKFHRQFIEILYEENKGFRIAVFETVKELALRFDKNKQIFNCMNILKYSTDYIKEECAVQLLMAEEGYDFVAYPGRRNFAMDKIYQLLVRAYFPEKFNWVDIKINS